jgi:hypothetical protein
MSQFKETFFHASGQASGIWTGNLWAGLVVVFTLAVSQQSR